jgi:hypothetical protein
LLLGRGFRRLLGNGAPSVPDAAGDVVTDGNGTVPDGTTPTAKPDGAPPGPIPDGVIDGMTPDRAERCAGDVSDGADSSDGAVDDRVNDL